MKASALTAVFDTRARPNLIQRDFLPLEWENHRKSVEVRFRVVEANGRGIPPIATVSLFLKIGQRK